MFDGNFRTGVDRVTKPIGVALVKARITADVLTVSGVVISIACAVAIGMGHFWVGLALLIFSALPDLLDGPVAKASGTQSIRGAFFDSVADRVTDSVVFAGVTYFMAANGYGTLVLIPVALLAASQLISYERAKAEIYGFDAKGGLMERAERIVVLCLALLFNQFLVAILSLMLALTVITGIQRFVKVWKQATDENPVLAARRRASRPIVRNFFEGWTDTDERTRRRWREWAEDQRQTRRRSRNERLR